MDQTNSGIFIHVIDFARIVCVVTMKFKPVRIDDQPMMKIPRTVGTTAAGERALYGV